MGEEKGGHFSRAYDGRISRKRSSSAERRVNLITICERSPSGWGRHVPRLRAYELVITIPSYHRERFVIRNTVIGDGRMLTTLLLSATTVYCSFFFCSNISYYRLERAIYEVRPEFDGHRCRDVRRIQRKKRSRFVFQVPQERHLLYYASSPSSKVVSGPRMCNHSNA